MQLKALTITPGSMFSCGFKGGRETVPAPMGQSLPTGERLSQQKCYSCLLCSPAMSPLLEPGPDCNAGQLPMGLNRIKGRTTPTGFWISGRERRKGWRRGPVPRPAAGEPYPSIRCSVSPAASGVLTKSCVSALEKSTEDSCTWPHVGEDPEPTWVQITRRPECIWQLG